MGNALRSGLSITIAVDSEAALGDPARVIDSINADALLSFARSLSLEMKRRDNTVNVVMTDTIDREDSALTGHDDRAVAARLKSLIDEGTESTGQELYLGAATHLGRLRP